MKFLLDPVAFAGFKKFVVLQFETVWTAATVDSGLVQGEVKAGTSHPDFGKGWEKLSPAVREFITRLCVMRSIHFAEWAQAGKLSEWIDASIGKATPTQPLQAAVARRLHADWMTLRAVMYTAWDDTVRQELLAAGLKPFGTHDGDKSWDEETEPQQVNDLRLVYRLGWLLDYCRTSDDHELNAYVESLLTSTM